MQQTLARSYYFLVFVILLGVGACAPQDGLLLEGEANLPAGTVVQSTSEFIVDNAMLTTELENNPLEGTMTTRQSALTKTETLSETRERIVKIRDVEETARTMFNRTDTETKENPLTGIPIIGEKREGVWTYTLEEGTPTSEQQAELDEMSDEGSTSESNYYPEHRVRVGDKWELDPELLSKFIGGEHISTDGAGYMELHEITMFEGHRCARIFISLSATGTMRDRLGYIMTSEIKLEGEVYRAIELMVDLSAEMQGRMRHSGDIDVAGNPAKMTIDGPITTKQKNTVALAPTER